MTSFADLDGDGDLDIAVGTEFNGIGYIQNTGTATDPVFMVRTGDANPFVGVIGGPDDCREPFGPGRSVAFTQSAGFPLSHLRIEARMPRLGRCPRPFSRPGPGTSGAAMIMLALMMGVALGLRFRVGLVLAATTVVVALDFGLRIGEDRQVAAILAEAALCAAITQGAGFLVHILKHARDAGIGARA